ncbi:FtsX-like permease family protein [bacterium]|nr:FtsX-like permease family protein [bacterium]
MTDLKFACRQLLKNPGFTAVAALTLALGIGANTVVFSWIRATLLDAIPGAAHEDRLVVLAPKHKSGGINDTMSITDIEELRHATNVFAGITGSQVDAMPVRVDREIEWFWGQAVQANFFDVVGVRPELGRTFRTGEDLAGATESVAVISHRLWQKRFAGAKDIIGRVIEVNERPVTIVGVAEPGFHGTMGGLGLDLWIPLPVHISSNALRERTESRGWRWLHTVARLRDGISMTTAQTVAGSIGQRLAHDFPNSSRDTTFVVLPLWKSPWGGQEIFLPLLQALSVVAILLLALVTANIANLLLARAQTREPEVAVRVALGAAPRQVIRQFLTESLLLAALGGALGIVLAMAGSKVLLQLMPPTYLPISYNLHIDSYSLAATCAITLLSGLVFGLMPALRAVRLNINDTLKAAGRSTTGAGTRHWLRRGLVIGEIALACVLLLGMGLCIRSFVKAQKIDFGLNPRNIWVAGFRVSPNVGDADWVKGLFRRLRQEAAQLPGVESAAIIDWLPLGFEDGSGGSVEIPGYTPRPGESMSSRIGLASPGYFETMQIPVLAGRAFRDDDARDPVRVAVVNQAFADRFFPGRDALGLKFKIWGTDTRIIGVVKTGKYHALNEPPFPYVYVDSETMDNRNLTIAVRTRGEPSLIAKQLETLATSIDPRLTPFAALSYETYMAAAFAIPRMAAVLLTVLGLIALGLAALGTYAVVAQGAQQRRREIGVRLALGAQRRDILRLIVSQGLLLALLGIGLGALIGIAVAQALTGVLVGIRATDLLAWLGTPVTLVLVTIIACWLPARRAASIDPMEALRNE